jgi:3-dehydroquinate synthase
MAMPLPDSVTLTRDPAGSLRSWVESSAYSRVGVLLDSNSARHCYPLIREGIPQHDTIEILAGEASKNLLSCEAIWDRLTRLQFDRHSLLVILGGGVLGDMGGFCAATYKRGIDFVLMPTTLLAQVDASIGGKLGIDFQGFKNHLGVFRNPRQVIISTRFLETLPEEEYLSGVAEIAKHCLLSDRDLWNELRSQPPRDIDLDKFIRHSVAFKAQVTSDDPLEAGCRKILNLGHTLGHALETWHLNSGHPVTHGAAIAAGLVIEGLIAIEKAGLSKDDLDGIVQYILRHFGKVKSLPDSETLVSLTLQDKKNKGGSVRYSLLKAIGQPVWDIPVDADYVKRALAGYAGLQI